jgi:NitT/TauT family transport system substrate-binding protein
MRAIIVFLVSAALIFCTACASAPSPTNKLDNIRLVGTIGPLSVPLAYMVENNVLSSVTEKTALSIWANPTQLQAIIAGGQGDFVSLPTNSGAALYNRGIALKLLDVSIWNILNLVTDDGILRA